MAANTEIAEIAGSLMIDEIPVKLRCAACDKLAVNAFRMPCCDQSICEDCQASLPQACPVCLHEPVNKDDCRPNKALRTTIKVFLKKKGVERDGMRKKGLAAQALAAPPTPATPTVEKSPTGDHSLPLSVLAPESQAVPADPTLDSQGASQGLEPLVSPQNGPAPPSADIPQQSIESPDPQDSPKRASTQTAAGEDAEQQDVTSEGQKTKKQDAAKAESIPSSQNNIPNVHDSNFGFDLNGNFPNMTNMNLAEFNPMMQLMQNGMPNNMMSQFPNMMGMPGMGMDPMTMAQGMFGSYGGPGMGSMNGMNMGMGFDAGQNAYGDHFNGRPQNFNQSHFNGHANGMGGNFGAGSNYGGNNMPQHQGNFNQMHQHQNFNNDFQHGYHNQGLHNRGRGRGRGAFFNGGRGRGYAPPAYQGRQPVQEQAFQSQLPEQAKRRGSPVYAPMQGSESKHQPEQTFSAETSGKVDEAKMKQSDEEQFNKELEPGGAEDDAETSNIPVKKDQGEMNEEQLISEKVHSEQQPEANPISTEEEEPRPIQSILSDKIVDATVSNETNSGPNQASMPPPTVQPIPTGPSKPMSGISVPALSPRGRGFGRGFIRGYADSRTVSRGRGSISLTDNPIHNHASSSVDSAFQAPSISKGLGVEGAPTGPKALRQGPSNISVKLPQDVGFSIMGRASAQTRPNGSLESPSALAPRSRSRSRSPSQSLARSPVHADTLTHRHDPRHSVSPHRESKRDKRRERHDRTSRKDGDYYEEPRESHGSRARDGSAHSSPQRSTHRNHHDYDKELSRSKHRSHRSHRNRTRSPDGQTRSNRKRSRTPELRISGASKRPLDDNHYKEKAEDEGRPSRKHRQRDDDGHDHDRKRSKRHKESDKDYEEQSHRSRHDRGDERGLRRDSKFQERKDDTLVEPSKSPKVDQHALEREARNRERQMKEIQRRALMEGKSSGTRGKTNGRANERRASYKYEDEDLTSRVEKERESGRWG